MLTTIAAALLVLASFGIALAALLLLTGLRRGPAAKLRNLARQESGATVFLFRDEALTDATRPARDLLSYGPARATDWGRLQHVLRRRFPDLAFRLADLATQGEVAVDAVDGTSCLRASWLDGVARLELVTGAGTLPDPATDSHAVAAMRAELDTLRATVAAIPYPVWHQDRDGTVSWASRAYLDLCEKTAGETGPRPWPPATLFHPQGDGQQQDGCTKYRLCLTAPGDENPGWFDVFEAASADPPIYTAAPADALVRAETVLSEFVTTLTKTFAHLPIGLAIFDRERRLVLFNPALSDLTTLPAEFLVSRPMLFSFFDRLREKRMMPEPKNYASWRHRMAELESESVNGTYQETWTLPGGQTYRITGQPHPNGAVAILFEDISAEISLTRRFRAELELNQSALDAMPDAVALFSRNGALVSSNVAFSELWGIDPLEVIAGHCLEQSVARWTSRSAPTRAWQALLKFACRGDARSAWNTGITLKDGRAVDMRVAPLARGALLVSFSLLRAGPADADSPITDSLISSA